MSDVDLNLLTDGQRDVLRLVFAGLKSAAIAEKLNISEHTVDQRCRIANRRLRTGNRFQSARMLAAHEGVGLYQPLIYQTPDIASVADPASVSVLPDRQAAVSSWDGSAEVRDAQAFYSPSGMSPQLPLPTPSHPRGRVLDGLSKAERLGRVIDATLKIVALIVLALAIEILLTKTLTY